ncbi:hypothetical protein [Streptomyces lunaelactis]|nr:hypothetical protein [Streptomyces lunaelactis]
MPSRSARFFWELSGDTTGGELIKAINQAVSDIPPSAELPICG